ncbi:hypothetical protein QBC47DRAFT_185451 [Echria macrotheca]|uniref:Uncharacterized protein n=1 Tax=Echria macrotheca TaxID=438768 RepID=A0AAJ0BEI8_9PEZI|nr:hypothetical protein QBC47DRAFT_185451 [Echria macrotheca]
MHPSLDHDRAPQPHQPTRPPAAPRNHKLGLESVKNTSLQDHKPARLLAFQLALLGGHEACKSGQFDAAIAHVRSQCSLGALRRDRRCQLPGRSRGSAAPSIPRQRHVRNRQRNHRAPLPRTHGIHRPSVLPSDPSHPVMVALARVHAARGLTVSVLPVPRRNDDGVPDLSGFSLTQPTRCCDLGLWGMSSPLFSSFVPARGVPDGREDAMRPRGWDDGRFGSMGQMYGVHR